VLRQDHRDLEYWVLDAGSKDGTVEILREYEGDPRFHWISEPDRGQSDAINKGLARCTGEIFNWINSDDYLEPGALARVAEAFEKNPHAEIVSGTTAEFRDPSPEEFNRVKLQMRASAEATIVVGVFCQPSTFWRTDIFRALGGVDLSMHFVMDWDLWVRYLARYGQKNVVRIDDLLAHYRHHPASKTVTGSAEIYDEAKAIFHNLHLTPQCAGVLPDARGRAPAGWQRRAFELGPEFDPTAISAAMRSGWCAPGVARTARRPSSGCAARGSHKPWITPWRVKMALRLMGQKWPAIHPALRSGCGHLG
jgi:hypothetical protein